MDKKDILNRLIDYYTKGNKAQFANILGVQPQLISAWLRRNTLDYELIYTKCIDISPHWLLTGEGEMIEKEKSEKSDKEDARNSNADLIKIISMQMESILKKDKQIDELIKLLKKANAHQEEDAECADASGFVMRG